ncbi:EspF repeat-containing protein [Streptomyces sp. TLI_171]|uniref:EspF repeat-containing protein n=1 Tax=Streptomyces sp. TLI_171 TaxID=1938859 RepID=UPI000D199D7D
MVSRTTAGRSARLRASHSASACPFWWAKPPAVQNEQSTISATLMPSAARSPVSG